MALDQPVNEPISVAAHVLDAGLGPVRFDIFDIGTRCERTKHGTRPRIGHKELQRVFRPDDVLAGEAVESILVLTLPAVSWRFGLVTARVDGRVAEGVRRRRMTHFYFRI